MRLDMLRAPGAWPPLGQGDQLASGPQGSWAHSTDGQVHGTEEVGGAAWTVAPPRGREGKG